MTPIEMNRRTALKSIAGASGVAMSSLGTLPSFAIDKPAAKVRAPKNLVIIVNVLGYNKRTFYPEGENLDKSPLLSRLSEHHGDLTMFRGMRQPSVLGGHGGDKGLLTCNYNQPNGQYISLDQFIGERIEQHTRFKTVHLGEKTLVWGKNSRPLGTMMGSPKNAFDRLFSTTPTDKLNRELEAIRIARQGISSSKETDDAYEKALDEREEELLVELDWAVRPVPRVKFDTQLHLDDFGRNKLSPFAQQLELIRLSMQHQRGQIFVSTPPHIDRTKLGVKGGYHTLGHRSITNQQEFEDMLTVEQHLMDGFSDFVTNLKNDGTLDDTIVLFMGAYSSPGVHRRENLPIVLAGGGFRHQGLIDCHRNGALQHPLSHLYVSIIHQMGLDIDQFGPDRGNIDKLIA
jgi:hypothetical protein